MTGRRRLLVLVVALVPLCACDMLARLSMPMYAGDWARLSTAPSWAPALSGDGEVVAYTSSAADLVPGDTNGADDVFVRNVRTRQVARANVRPDGGQSSGPADEAALSGDGRFVAFVSPASDLVAGDTNGVADVFVRDRVAGTTERVSVSSAGAQAGGASSAPALSADGRYVAFVSTATDLTAGDTNGVADVFVRDRTAGTTTRVSVTASGGQATGASTQPSISPSGEWVAFTSTAANLVSGDSNGVADVFVARRTGGTVRRASAPDTLSRPFQQANGASGRPSVSDRVDGYTGGGEPMVAYESVATNLTGSDQNGSGSDVFVTTHVLGSVARTVRVSTGADGGQQPALAVPDGGPLTTATFVRGDGHVVTAEVASPISGDAPSIRVVSRSDGGDAANGPSDAPAVTPDGRFVAFSSTATNLADEPNSGVGDIYLGRARDTVVSSVEPPRLAIGETRDLVVRGSGFDATSTVGFDTGVTVNSVTFVSSGELVANVTGTGTVPGDAWRDVTVTSPGAGGTQGGRASNTCVGCVEVAAIVEQAGPVEIEVLGGELLVGTTTLPLPACTSDDCVGLPATVSYDGELTFGVDSIELDPIPVPIQLIQGVETTVEVVPTFTAPAGSVVPATGDVTLSGGLALRLRASLLPSSCAIGPVQADLSAGPGGDPTGVPYDQGTGTATVAGGFTEALAVTGCGFFTGVINAALGLPVELTTNRVELAVRFDPVLTGTATP